MAHQYMPKIFHDPHKTGSPSYILNVKSLISCLFERISIFCLQRFCGALQKSFWIEDTGCHLQSTKNSTLSDNIESVQCNLALALAITSSTRRTSTEKFYQKLQSFS